MKVWVQLYSGEERTYENVIRIDDSDRYRITIYSNMGVLAIINNRVVPQ